MWLKSVLQSHYNINKKANSVNRNKSINELLTRIINVDCADWYAIKYVHPTFGRFDGAMLKIDFDNNKAEVKILMSFYKHEGSNIRKLYNQICILPNKQYHVDSLSDMISYVDVNIPDINRMKIIFSYNKDLILQE